MTDSVRARFSSVTDARKGLTFFDGFAQLFFEEQAARERCRVDC